MIRAFTISFEFDGKTYLALTSVDSTAQDTSFFVRLYDDPLYRIIPGGSIRFTERDSDTPGLTHPSARRLVDCISQSINDHLKCCQKQTGLH